MRTPSFGSIAAGSTYTLFVYFLRLLTQFILLLLLARWLGPSKYGEFAGIAALAMALGTLAAFGLGFLVLAATSKNPKDGDQLLATAISASILSFLVLLPLYFWLAATLFNSSVSLVSLALLGTSELLVGPIILLLGYRLHGLGLVALSQALGIWPIALRLFGLTVGLALDLSANIEIYAYIHCLGTLTALAVVLTIVDRKASLPKRQKWIDLQTVAAGLRFAIMNFTAMLPGELDKILALRFLISTDAGMYALASRGIGFVALPVTAMLQAALPRLIHGFHHSTSDWRTLLRTIIILSLAYGFTAAALLYTIAPPLVTWLLGPAYYGFASVIKNISIICPFISLRIATGAALFAFGLPLTRTIIEGIAVSVTLVSAPFLITTFGLTGLILAVFAGELIMGIAGAGILVLHFRRH